MIWNCMTVSFLKIDIKETWMGIIFCDNGAQHEIWGNAKFDN